MEIIEIRNRNDYLEKLDDRLMMRSFNVYVRVSTKDQIENTSLDNQRDLGIKYLKQNYPNDFESVIVWREEGKSGDDFIYDETIGGLVKRELLSIIMEKWKLRLIKNIWIYDLSRISRNDDTSNLVKSMIYQSGIDLYINNQKYDFDNKMDKLLFGVLSLVNEFENHQRFEKGLMGKKKNLEIGKWWGGPLPFGYKLDDGNKLIDDKDKSRFVKRIFDLYSKGKTTTYIKGLLERIGVETQRGNKVWNTNSLRLILTNRLYIGEMKYEVKELKGKSKEYCRERGLVSEYIFECERIISDEVFEKVQNRIQTNKRKRKPTKYPTLLRGLMYCGGCGQLMYSRINPKKHIKLYCCNTNINKWRDSRVDSCSTFRSMNIDLTDDLVWLMVLSIWDKSELVKENFRINNLPSEMRDKGKLKKKINSFNVKIGRRKKRIEEINNRKDELLTEYLSLKINKEQMKKLTTSFKESIGKEEKEIKDIESQISVLEDGTIWENWFDDFLKYKDEIKRYSTLSEKKELLNTLVDKVYVDWDDVTKTHNIKIFFKFNMVKDKGKRIDDNLYEIKKGKGEYEMNDLDYKDLYKKYKKFKDQNPSYINYSTVTDFAKFLG